MFGLRRAKLANEELVKLSEETRCSKAEFK